MKDTNVVRLLPLCHDPSEAEKDMRRAQAVLETRRLKRLLDGGLIPRQQYVDHLKELSRFIELGFDSGVSIDARNVLSKKQNLDKLLINYLLGGDNPSSEDDSDDGSKQVLGSW